MTTKRTDTSHVVVIKRYDNQRSAHIDAELLRSEGVECSVSGAENPLAQVIQGAITLTVSEQDVPRALKIVPESAVEE